MFQEKRVLMIYLTILGIFSIANASKSREHTPSGNQLPLDFLRHDVEQPIKTLRYLPRGVTLRKSPVLSLNTKKRIVDGTRDAKDLFLNNSGVNKDVCDRYDVDGCSVPFQLPFFYKSRFTTSCFRHDICYHCGIDFNVSRKKCDDEFRALMRSACKSSGYQQGDIHDTPNTRLHRQRVLESLEKLKGQFDSVLRRELAAILKSSDGVKNYTPEQFTADTESIQQGVIKTWAWLLQRRLKLMGDPNSKSNINNNNMVSNYTNKETLNNWRERRESGSQNLTQLNYIISQHRRNMQDIETKCASLSDQGTSINNMCEEVLWDLDKRSGIESTLTLPDIGLMICFLFKDLYYYAVRIFGNSSYLRTTSWYCGESWINQCIPD